MKTSRIAATTVGIYAGLLGMAHGYFEVQQGSITPDGFTINAIGTSCQPESVAHACFPALTLIPNILVSGILTMALSIAVVLWSILFIDHKYGSPIMATLSIVMLLIGAGFLPPFYAFLAALTASQIDASSTWLSKYLNNAVVRFLGALWLFPLIVYLLGIATQLILADALNDLLLNIGGVLLPLETGLLLLGILSAIAHDNQRQPAGHTTLRSA